jgi:hypothetical protein
MTDRNDTHSDALQAAAARRVELKGTVSALEVATARPFAHADWRETVLAALDDLRLALLAHVQEVEADDGLLAELTGQAPRLVNQINRMRDEHPVLCAQVDAAITSVKTKSESDELRDEIVELLFAIVRHRQKGADLVYEGYDVDIGGS